VSPASLAWSGKQIELQVAVDGPSEAVELLHDGAPLADLGAARQFTWDTRAEPVVVHLLVARARLGERVVTSAPLEVTVDHTAPALVARDPKGVAEEAWDGVIALAFAESMAASLQPSGDWVLGDRGCAVPATLTVSPSGNCGSCAAARRKQTHSAGCAAPRTHRLSRSAEPPTRARDHRNPAPAKVDQARDRNSGQAWTTLQCNP
jgi:hypothetical protein